MQKLIYKLVLCSFFLVGFSFELGKKEKSKEDLSVSISEPCNKLVHMFGVSTKATQLQLEEYWKLYDNKIAEWDMVVSKVSSQKFGSGFDVSLACKNTNSLLGSDLLVEYPKEAKEMLLKLSEGSPIRVKVKLTGYTRLGGLYGDAIFDSEIEKFNQNQAAIINKETELISNLSKCEEVSKVLVGKGRSKSALGPDELKVLLDKTPAKDKSGGCQVLRMGLSELISATNKNPVDSNQIKTGIHFLKQSVILMKDYKKNNRITASDENMVDVPVYNLAD